MERSRIFRSTIKLCRLPGLLAALALVPGCYGGAEDASGEPTAGETGGGGGGATGPMNQAEAGSSSGGGGATSSVSDCDARETETVTLDQAFWQSGFEVTLGDAVLTPSTKQCASGQLVIDAEFFNRGLDSASFDTRVLLTSNGNDYVEGWDDLPYVPGERTGKGTFTFDVDPDFLLDDATLIIGDAGYNQAIMPIGAKAAEALVSLEPQDLTFPGSAEAGVLKFEFSNAFVRADLPGSHDTLPDDELQLGMDVAITFQEDNGGSNVFASHFLLRLPDGQSVSPDVSWTKTLYNVGETFESYLRFTIKSPVSGKYALGMRGPWSASNDDVEAEVPFEIGSLPALGE